MTAPGKEVSLRPTMTGAPGNVFLVNSAANEGEGLSRAITVNVIAIVLLGNSKGTKVREEVPTRNPTGRAARDSTAVKYSLSLLKVSPSPLGNDDDDDDDGGGGEVMLCA